MKLTNRFSACALAAVLGGGILTSPMVARADERSHKNNALALGAAAGLLLATQRDKNVGVLLGAGAAYEYSQYQRDVNRRHERERYGYYGDRSDRYDNRYDRYDNRNDRYRNDRYDTRYDRYENTNYDRYDRNRYDTYDRYDRYDGGNRYNRQSDRYED